MLNTIIVISKNKNQNYNDILHSYWNESNFFKKAITTSMAQNAKKLTHSFTTGGSVK